MIVNRGLKVFDLGGPGSRRVRNGVVRHDGDSSARWVVTAVPVGDDVIVIEPLDEHTPLVAVAWADTGLKQDAAAPRHD